MVIGRYYNGNSELGKGADFDTVFEIPIIKAPEIIAIPKAIVPFSKRDKVTPSSFAICDYYRHRIITSVK